MTIRQRAEELIEFHSKLYMHVDANSAKEILEGNSQIIEKPWPA